MDSHMVLASSLKIIKLKYEPCITLSSFTFFFFFLLNSCTLYVLQYTGKNSIKNVTIN